MLGIICPVVFGLIVEPHSVGLLLLQAVQVSSSFTMEIQVLHRPYQVQVPTQPLMQLSI
jgi:hypothetical protein